MTLRKYGSWTCFILSVLNPGTLLGSTFSYDGTVVNGLWNGGTSGVVGSFGAVLLFPSYTSSFNTGYPGYADGGIVIEVGRGTASISGQMVSLPTFARALQNIGRGRPIRVYENTHWDLHLAPPYEVGQFVGVNPDGNEVTLLVYSADRVFHAVENPELEKRLRIAPNAEFWLDGERRLTREAALAMPGRWLQVIPSQAQIIWVETSASDYDWTTLRNPINGQRGYANSYSGNGVITGVSSTQVTFDQLRQGLPISDFFANPEAGAGASLDGKIVPPAVAFKPGRHLVLNYYRGELKPHQRYVRTRDDEIRGVISAVGFDSLTITAVDWGGRPYTIEVPRSPTGLLLLDGTPTPSAQALAVGRRVRVFPEHAQRLVLLNEYRPTPSGEDWQPVACFTMSDNQGTGVSTFTFDGSFSYDPDEDDAIVAWQWSLGDGTTATTPAVTHTYDPASQFQSYRVSLTVTNNDGLVSRHTRYVYVSPNRFASVEYEPADLTPGVRFQSWEDAPILNSSVYPAILATPPTYRDTAYADFREGGADTDANSGRLNRYSGYFWAPEDGDYQLVADFLMDSPVPSGAMRLFVDGQRVVANPEIERHGPYQAYLGQRTLLHLESGLHGFVYESNGRSSSARLGWMGPGTSAGNPRNALLTLYREPPGGLPGPTLDALKQTQTITVPAVADRFIDEGPWTMVGTASSGLPISWELVSGPAQLAGTVVTPTGAEGRVVLRATQAGNATFNPAPWVYEFVHLRQRTFAVTVQVQSPQGAPLYDAKIQVDGRSYRTDSAGVAVLPLANGPHPLSLSLSGYQNAAVTVTVAGAPQSLPVILTESEKPVSLFALTGDTAVVQGETLTLAARALGHPAPAYQWRRGGVNLAGQTSPELILPNTAPGDAGRYSVVVSNTVGGTLRTVTSPEIDVTVVTPLAATILTPPEGFNAAAYTAASLRVVADGRPAPTFQWLKDGVPLGPSERWTGETGPTLDFLSLREEDSGGYAVRVANRDGSVTSAAVTVLVGPPVGPTITGVNRPNPINVATEARFTVAATGSQPLLYQWFVDGAPLANGPEVSGATGPDLTLLKADSRYDAKTMRVEVTNLTGLIAAESWLVDINYPPVARVGAPQIIVDSGGDGGETVMLEATTSSDPDDDLTSYSWTWPGGTATIAAPVVTFPVGTSDVRLTLTDSNGLQTSALSYVTVVAQDSPTGPFLEQDGLLVMEAENYLSNPVREDTGEYGDVTWRRRTSRAGYSGPGYMVPEGTSLASSQSWELGCEINFPIKASETGAGTYTLWLRRLGPDGGTNSCQAGIDDTYLSFVDNLAASSDWSWIKGPTVTLSGAVQLLQLRRRELGYLVDRVVLAKDPEYVPSGLGPPESAREGGPDTAPIITVEPLSVTVFETQTAFFSVGATGNPAPTFQWERNGEPLAGATSATLSLVATLADHGAQWRCRVTNSVGQALSQSAVLSVQPLTGTVAPQFTVEPQNQGVVAESSVTFTVAASGNPAPTLQWYRNGLPLTGATTPVLTFIASLADHGAAYTCVATNLVGSDTSAAAILSVTNPLLNLPPVAHAGPNQYVEDIDGNGSEAVLLSGTKSFDPDGRITALAWSWPGGTATGPIVNTILPIGTHPITLTVTDDRFATAEVTLNLTIAAQGRPLQPVPESNGLIVWEAEDYSGDIRNGDGSQFEIATTVGGFVGSGYIRAGGSDPDGAKDWNEGAAEVNYRLRISTEGAGGYRVWVRRYATGGQNNSCHIGLNGAVALNAVDNKQTGYGSWTWLNLGTINIPAGDQLLQLRRRELGYAVDRFALALDTAFTPSGGGPAASNRPEAPLELPSLDLQRQGEAIQLIFPSQSGVTYVLESRDAIGQGQWSAATGFAPLLGNGALRRFEITLPTHTSRFWRIVSSRAP